MPIGQPEGGNSPGTPLPFHTKTEHQFLSHGLKTVHRTVFLTAFLVLANHKETADPDGVCCFLVARQGLVCIFAKGENCGRSFVQPKLPDCPPDSRILDLRVPTTYAKSRHPEGVPAFWWLARDSFAFSPGSGRKQRFGSVKPSPPTRHRRVGFDHSSPLCLSMQKAGTPKGYLLFGGSPGTRTLDPRLKRALLYQLS